MRIRIKYEAVDYLGSAAKELDVTPTEALKIVLLRDKQIQSAKEANDDEAELHKL